MKKWVIGKPAAAIVAALQSQSDLSRLCCCVLASQGCESISEAVSLIGCNELSDPFLLCDMQEAADRINRALDEGERICIFGDYDCDGVMATVILYSFLSEIGADVTWRIPERSEGYGLNEQAVRAMHEDGVQLIVTVDNGISAIEEAKLIAELGMDLVVTDHHQPGRELPQACAVVDAHREDNYSPFRLYCGAGIALLLVAALNDGDTEMALEQFGDLAAIATIADVVSLTGENRYLVQMGLQYLENTERGGLRSLREVSGIAGHPLTATNVAFSLSPRINAAGRMRSPQLAVELLLDDTRRAAELAQELNTINASRKECEAQIIDAVLESIAENPQLLHERVLVFSGRNWHTGVMGIVASRLVERFGKPCIVISIEDGFAHGSARSVGDFSIFGCLTACDDLLVKYGGHPAAGGLTVREENLPALKERIAQYAAQQHPVMPTLELKAACALEADMLTVDAVQSLERLEPFGAGNPEPVFVAENAEILEIRPLKDGLHTKLIVRLHGQRYDALLFRMSPESTGLAVGMVCHMMVKLDVNTYNGNSTVSMIVQDYRVSGLKQLKILSAMQTYDSYWRGESLSAAVVGAICPTREECVTVYKEVPEKGIPMEQLMLAMYQKDINYCKMRICLDIFCELGLVTVDYRENKAVRCHTSKKVDLQASAILRTLQEKKEVMV